MIDGLKPYPEYMASGQRWLGQLPRHWQLAPHRLLFAEINDRDHPDAPMLSVTITKGVIGQRTLLADSSKKDSSRQDKSAYKLVCPGDIAYNKMRAWQGSIGASDLRGIVSPAYVVMRLREAHLPAYFHHLFRTPAFASEAERWSYGITSDMWSLRAEHFKMLYSPLPPPEEQAAIVLFLDHANRQIDRFIHTKRKLIALLNEQKQAIIQHAVTRGLDPNVPMKDSGIASLQAAPAHWDVSALRRYWEVVDCKHLTVPFVADGIPLASVREVRKFDLSLEHSKKTTNEWYLLLTEGRRKPKRDDLIYCRNASVGSVAIVNTDESFAMGQDVCLIRSTGQNQRFLNYVLHSRLMTTQLELLLVGSTFKRINVADIKALTVVVPPRPEQDAICRFLDAELLKVDATIARATQEITLLREYRTRLTADVVTGQLDVGEAARALPEQLPEAPADSLDDDADLGEDEAVEEDEAE